MTTDQPVLGGEEDTSGLRARVMRETSPEGLLRAELKGLLGVDDVRRGVDVDRLIGHSVQLNTIGWRMAQALGDVPEGAVEVDGDPVGLADRLIAEVVRLRALVDTAEAPLDASVYAERIAGVLREKVWQHAKPETVAHARQVLEPVVRNLIFQVARAMVPTAKAVFGDDEPAARPSGGDTTLDEAIEAARIAVENEAQSALHETERLIVRLAVTAAREVFTARHAAKLETSWDEALALGARNGRQQAELERDLAEVKARARHISAGYALTQEERRQAADRVRVVRPGVEPHVALAVVEALLADGWLPGDVGASRGREQAAQAIEALSGDLSDEGEDWIVAHGAETDLEGAYRYGVLCAASAARGATPTPATSPRLGRLAEIRALQPGWLDGQGLVPDPDTLDAVEALIRAYGLDVVRFYPTEAGGMTLEWEDGVTSHELVIQGVGDEPATPTPAGGEAESGADVLARTIAAGLRGARASLRATFGTGDLSYRETALITDAVTAAITHVTTES